jgi:hypothetical protein
MAEVTRRRTGELLRSLFKILLDHPEGLQAGKALDQLANTVTLTEYEAGNYESSGGRRFEKIVRFATVDCVKAGWFLKQKGTWFVTDTGKTAYAKYTDPESFYREACRLYRAWKTGQKEKNGGVTAQQVDDGAGVEAASITFEEAEEQAWSEIEQYLRGMNPFDFQHLVADLLRAMGYHVSWVFCRNATEFRRVGSALFHNINYRQVPLPKEHNLRLILDDTDLFSDDKLKEDASFGWPYYQARKLHNHLDLELLPNLKSLIETEPRSFLVDQFSYLTQVGVLNENENAVKRFKEALAIANARFNDLPALKDMGLYDDKQSFGR